MSRIFKYFFLFVLLAVALALTITFKNKIFNETINLTCKGTETSILFFSSGRPSRNKNDKLMSVTLIRLNIPFSAPQLKIVFGSDSLSNEGDESNISESNPYIKGGKVTANEQNIISIDFLLNKVTKEINIYKSVEILKNDSVRDTFFNGVCSEVRPL